MEQKELGREGQAWVQVRVQEEEVGSLHSKHPMQLQLPVQVAVHEGETPKHRPVGGSYVIKWAPNVRHRNSVVQSHHVG